MARSTSVANMLFAIPPGDADYQVSAEGTFENDTLVANMTPHMHTRGKSFRYEVTYPDGKQEILLDVPRYDFNWQTTYMLEEPKLLPKGTEARLHGPLGQFGGQSFESRSHQGRDLGSTRRLKR